MKRIRETVWINSGGTFLFLLLLTATFITYGSGRAADFYVSPDGSHTPPFNSWQTASTNIQDAIEAASAGDTIVVTNGLYSTGGKVIAGDLTNRVAVDKAVQLSSVNGPDVTIIQGGMNQSQAVAGPSAVRCVWLADGATLNGFTLRFGGTRNAGDATTLQSGGGAFCASPNAILTNCVVTNCFASVNGGGMFSGTVFNCSLVGNLAAQAGGGAHSSAIFASRLIGNVAGTFGNFGGAGAFGGTLRNCVVAANLSNRNGGGCHSSALINCTVTGNSSLAPSGGGGIYQGVVTNCIIVNNDAQGQLSNWTQFNPPTIRYSCTTPLPSGNGNISADPLLLDEAHIAIGSPCRGVGIVVPGAAKDIDGEDWANPPSMGCDEVWEEALTGPITLSLSPTGNEVVTNRSIALSARPTGRVGRLDWTFSDTGSVTNTSYRVIHAWANEGMHTVTLTAYNADYPEGVSSNFLFHAAPLVLPTLGISRNQAGEIDLDFSTQLGVVYTIQYAPVLPATPWRFLTSVWNMSGPARVSDSTSDPVRFYRVQAR